MLLFLYRIHNNSMYFSIITKQAILQFYSYKRKARIITFLV
jgi:hypothetical protein